MLSPAQKATISKLNLKHPAIWAATWLGFGFMPKAPGTWGSLGALPFAVLLLESHGVKALLLGFIFISLIGLWASREFIRQSGEDDSPMIVIDEAAGLCLALLPAAGSTALIIAAFVLFRMFDILKPWPISLAERRIKGAPGVMIDDMLAGILSALCLLLLQLLW